MQGRKSPQAKLFYGFSLEQAVPQDDFYRKLEKVVDLLWVRQQTEEHYSEIGRPSIDPVVFVKIELIGYLEGISSERKLIREIEDRLSLRRYIGYDIDEEIPDHSSLSKTRALLGKELCQAIFDYSVRLCQNAGMVGGVHISGDRSVVRANASLDSLEPRTVHETPEQFVNRVFAENAVVAAEQEGPNPLLSIEERVGYPRRLGAQEAAPIQNDPAPPEDGAQEAVSTAEGAVESSEDEEVLVPDKDGTKCPTNRTHFSRTDPDAALVSRPGKAAVLAYAAEYWTDSRAKVITHADAVSGSLPEEDTVMGALRRQRQELHLAVASVSLDRGYGLGLLYRQLNKGNVVGFVPHQKYVNMISSAKLFTQKDFAYDEKRNVFTCPAGKELKYSYFHVQWPKANHVWSAKASDCRECSLRPKCKLDKQAKSKDTSSESARSKAPRTLHRSIYQVHYDEMNKRLAGIGARLARVARKTGPEPAFAEGKQWHGLGRAKYRGLEKFRGQVLLTATAQNIKKLVRWTWREMRGAGAAKHQQPPHFTTVAKPGYV